MTPENMPAPPTSKTSQSAVRPPEFLLPKTDKGSRRREGEPDVYVSWGDQIFGPAAVEDIVNGVRTSYFEKDALFWFEGREEWRPVAELPALFDSERTAELPREARQHPSPPEAIKPEWPRTRTPPVQTLGERRRRSRRSRPGKKSRAKNAGRLIVLGAVLLAVAVTAGLLLLISSL